MSHIQTADDEKLSGINLELFSLFEAFLGASSGEDNIFSFDAALLLEQNALYPLKQVEALNHWKFNHFFIPVAEGGKLASLTDLLILTRLLARRDLCCAIAYGGTFLGAITTWVAGSKELKGLVARHIREGKKIAFALTEKGTGSDLLASLVFAEYVQDAYELSGEKWLYNHASKSNFTTVLARTDKNSTGPRSCSLFYVPTLGEYDKRQAPSTIKSLDRIHTVGLKGLDLGGVTFQRHKVPADFMIGKPGAGLELSLLGLQVTRTLCASLSLGSLDTLLRKTVQFCQERVLYKRSILEIPVLRSKLINTFLDIITSESLCMVACRAAQVVPAQFGMLSAITKAFVPSLVESHTHELASLLGARSYITSETDYKIFQKQARDNSIISIFDGNTYVNYQYVLQQMKIVFSLLSAANTPPVESLNILYKLDRPLAPVDFSKLSVVGKGKDDLAFGLEYLKKEIEVCAADDLTRKDLDILLSELDYLSGRMDALRSTFLKEDPMLNNAYVIQPEVFQYAHQYAMLHAVSAVANIIRHNRRSLNARFSWPLLLKLSLQKASASLKGEFFKVSEEDSKRMIEHILYCYQESYLFSLFPIKVS